MSGEMLGSRLSTLHNLHHVIDLMRRMREAIGQGRLDALRAAFWAERGLEPPGE